MYNFLKDMYIVWLNWIITMTPVSKPKEGSWDKIAELFDGTRSI
jgi:hypothetical protein